jgi:hypothetical protein
MGNVFGVGGGGGGGDPPPPFAFYQCQGSTTDCCNGIDGLCDFGVNEIMFAMTHNAMSSREGGLPILFNHLYELEGSLVTGFRGIGLDLCNCDGNYELCHGVCFIGSRSLKNVFGSIVQFLNDNPTEVILVTLQLDGNAGGPISLDDFYQALRLEVPELLDMMYAHAQGIAWPTLGELKAAGKRIMLFHYNGPNDCSNGQCPPGLHFWWDYAAETPFSFDSIDDLLDIDKSCSITRGAGSTMDFFGVNAFTTPPSQSDAEFINSESFLQTRIDDCSTAQMQDVNVVSVDFWSVGELPKVVQERNTALVAGSS